MMEYVYVDHTLQDTTKLEIEPNGPPGELAFFVGPNPLGSVAVLPTEDVSELIRSLQSWVDSQPVEQPIQLSGLQLNEKFKYLGTEWTRASTAAYPAVAATSEDGFVHYLNRDVCVTVFRPRKEA